MRDPTVASAGGANADMDGSGVECEGPGRAAARLETDDGDDEILVQFGATEDKEALRNSFMSNRSVSSSCVDDRSLSERLPPADLLRCPATAAITEDSDVVGATDTCSARSMTGEYCDISEFRAKLAAIDMRFGNVPASELVREWRPALAKLPPGVLSVCIVAGEPSIIGSVGGIG